jgi:hypothetical protein
MTFPLTDSPKNAIIGILWNVGSAINFYFIAAGIKIPKMNVNADITIWSLAFGGIAVTHKFSRENYSKVS